MNMITNHDWPNIHLLINISDYDKAKTIKIVYK